MNKFLDNKNVEMAIEKVKILFLKKKRSIWFAFWANVYRYITLGL